MVDQAFIPDEPTVGIPYFRPSPLPREPVPHNPTLGYLVLLAGAPSLSLEELDALPETERMKLALLPLDLVVGGVASADSMLGQGRLGDARQRFHDHKSRDEFGLMTVGLMYLETGSGLARRTYNPSDLMLQSVLECRPGSLWRPMLAKRYPSVPDRWRTL